MSKQILIVDDDELMRRSLFIRLKGAGYQPYEAATGEDAIEKLRQLAIDLVLLDISMPGMDGLETLRAIQSEVGEIRVIFVTAHRRGLDEIVGLELGADDYITKPFDMDILLAHIKAVLRRAISKNGMSNPLNGTATERNIEHETEITAGDICINQMGHTVHIGQQLIELRRKEYDLLLAFAQNPNRVLSTDELIDQVWGKEWVGESQTIYVHIRWLREKIEEDPANPCRLLTVRGVGYKLVS